MVLCATARNAGSRTRRSQAAVAAGYTKIYWFRGGMPEWREKHLPVEGSAGAAMAKIPAPQKTGGRAVVVAVR